jgi:UDP-N-acetylglucosamine acyltransferase
VWSIAEQREPELDINNDPIASAGTMGEVEIHPTAIVDHRAELSAGVQIGPYSIIGPGVHIGAGSRIGPHVLIERDTHLGENCVVSNGAVLGTDPQDLKYDNEPTQLHVGDRTVIREYATLNRGTSALGYTSVGSDCMLMAYVHVAHDCEVGNNVILSNAVNMGGHVTIGDWAIVGGVTAIHQFVRVGAHAFVGGASRVSKDIPPYVRAAGSPVQMYGLNSVGLQRRGFSEEVRRELKRAYRLFFASTFNTSQALARARQELRALPEIETFLAFFSTSERGVSL